jgi:hypothetical protein
MRGRQDGRLGASDNEKTKKTYVIEKIQLQLRYCVLTLQDEPFVTCSVVSRLWSPSVFSSTPPEKPARKPRPDAWASSRPLSIRARCADGCRFTAWSIRSRLSSYGDGLKAPGRILVSIDHVAPILSRSVLVAEDERFCSIAESVRAENLPLKPAPADAFGKSVAASSASKGLARATLLNPINSPTAEPGPSPARCHETHRSFLMPGIDMINSTAVRKGPRLARLGHRRNEELMKELRDLPGEWAGCFVERWRRVSRDDAGPHIRLHHDPRRYSKEAG